MMLTRKLQPNKSSSWTSAPSDYNSMSDSQFLFGSQFCPENSQSTSAPTEFSIQQRQEKGSQQNSQDNEPSIFAKYQSKPQLFREDGKDKGSLNFPPGRFKGVLEQFEENKKKIKEKHDNEVLNTYILNTKDSLQRLQSSFDKFEETLKSILDGLGNLSKTMQETSQSYYGLVLNALKERHEMEQALFGMEKRMQDKDTEISDLKSGLQLLKSSLEQLTAQQNEQYVKLCELLGHMQIPGLLAEFQAFISAPRPLLHIKDNSSQTSPGMLSTQLHYSSQDNGLNAPPGVKVFPTGSGSGGEEHVDIQRQEKSCIPAREHNADTTLPACGSSVAITTGSQKECCLLTQDTPVRKVIKRSTRVKALNTMSSSQLHKTDIKIVQNKAYQQKNENLVKDKKMQSQGRRSSIKGGGSQKIRSQGKEIHSSRKGGNCLKRTNPNAKPNVTRKKYSKSEKPQNRRTDTRNPDDSYAGTSVVSEKRMCGARNNKAEKGKLLLQSQENKQSAANLQEMSGVKNQTNLSKNYYYFGIGSSPEVSTSPSQKRWFGLFDNHSPASYVPLQRKTTTYCQLFFDSEYSD